MLKKKTKIIFNILIFLFCGNIVLASDFKGIHQIDSEKYQNIEAGEFESNEDIHIFYTYFTVIKFLKYVTIYK